MTPIAQKIFDINPFSPSIDGAHFYECAAIQEVEAAASALLPRGNEFLKTIRLRLPFPITWVEFVHHGERRAWRFSEHRDGVVWTETRIEKGRIEVCPLGMFRNGVADVDTLEYDARQDKEFVLRSAIGAIALLLIVNTPQSFVQRSRVARAFVRRNATKIADRPWALGAYKEIVLEVNPETVRAVTGSTERVTGRKALHWVRGHWQRIWGEWTWRAPHIRGDGALGICNTKYQMRMTGGGKAKRDAAQVMHQSIKKLAVLHA